MTSTLDAALRSATKEALRWFPYLSSFVPYTVSTSTTGAATRTAGTATATGVPTHFESIRNPITQVFGAKDSVRLTHRVFVEATAEALAITRDYEIQVAAKGNEPGIIFTNPVKMEGAFVGIVQFAASVKE